MNAVTLGSLDVGELLRKDHCREHITIYGLFLNVKMVVIGGRKKCN